MTTSVGRQVVRRDGCWFVVGGTEILGPFGEPGAAYEALGRAIVEDGVVVTADPEDGATADPGEPPGDGP
jgi:hypothetical protein